MKSFYQFLVEMEAQTMRIAQMAIKGDQTALNNLKNYAAQGQQDAIEALKYIQSRQQPQVQAQVPQQTQPQVPQQTNPPTPAQPIQVVQNVPGGYRNLNRNTPNIQPLNAMQYTQQQAQAAGLNTNNDDSQWYQGTTGNRQYRM